MIIILVISCFVGVLTYMILQLRASNALLLRLSTTDVMTGCNNRRAYEEEIREISLHGMGDDFVYVSADLNGLKYINDTFGHTAGDEMISGATLCLQNGLGPYGSLYRIGGDEYAALIRVKDETPDAIIEKVNSIVDGWKGHSVDKISISIGYASHSEFPDMTVEELGKIADKKMYEAKSAYYEKHDRRRRQGV